MQQGKSCSRCGEYKPYEGYHRNRRAPDGRQPHCKECEKVRGQEYRARPDVAARMRAEDARRWREDPKRRAAAAERMAARRATREGRDEWRRSQAKNKYGIPPDEFDRAFAEFLRDGCPICGDRIDESDLRRLWAWDHDHSCCPGTRSCGNCVRGLICSRCNSMLGHARDNPDFLESAAEYLRAHRARK